MYWTASIHVEQYFNQRKHNPLDNFTTLYCSRQGETFSFSYPWIAALSAPTAHLQALTESLAYTHCRTKPVLPQWFVLRPHSHNSQHAVTRPEMHGCTWAARLVSEKIYTGSRKKKKPSDHTLVVTTATKLANSGTSVTHTLASLLSLERARDFPPFSPPTFQWQNPTLLTSGFRHFHMHPCKYFQVTLWCWWLLPCIQRL